MLQQKSSSSLETHLTFDTACQAAEGGERRTPTRLAAAALGRQGEGTKNSPHHLVAHPVQALSLQFLHSKTD
jgi:hypothetical protein